MHKFTFGCTTNLVNKHMCYMTSSQSQRIQLTSCAAGADYDAVVRSRVQMVCVGTVPRDGFWDILYSLDCI